MPLSVVGNMVGLWEAAECDVGVVLARSKHLARIARFRVYASARTDHRSSLNSTEEAVPDASLDTSTLKDS